MELKSQEMRKLAPELDPLRIGTGWTPEDLEKPQIIIEVLSETAIPEADTWIPFVEEVRERGGRGPAAMEQGISVPTSAMEKAREPTASITALPAGKSSLT